MYDCIVSMMLFNFCSFKEVAAHVDLSVGVSCDGSVMVWGKTGGKLHDYNRACFVHTYNKYFRFCYSRSSVFSVATLQVRHLSASTEFLLILLFEIQAQPIVYSYKLRAGQSMKHSLCSIVEECTNPLRLLRKMNPCPKL